MLPRGLSGCQINLLYSKIQIKNNPTANDHITNLGFTEQKLKKSVQMCKKSHTFS